MNQCFGRAQGIPKLDDLFGGEKSPCPIMMGVENNPTVRNHLGEPMSNFHGYGRKTKQLGRGNSPVTFGKPTKSSKATLHSKVCSLAKAFFPIPTMKNLMERRKSIMPTWEEPTHQNPSNYAGDL